MKVQDALNRINVMISQHRVKEEQAEKNKLDQITLYGISKDRQALELIHTLLTEARAGQKSIHKLLTEI